MKATKTQFTGTILSGHKEAAVEVPFDPAKKWNIATESIRPGRRGYRVHGVFAGAPFQSFIVARSKRFWVLVEEKYLKISRVSVGDTVTIAIEPDIN